jgi:cytochrome P450 family 142 subfamily A polypeptide 1
MKPNLDVDFLHAAAWDAEMPARWRWLHANDPLHWSERSGVWLVTKYEDVVAISKNQALFTSAEGVRPQRDVKIGLIDEAEPRHTQLRNLINKGFTPRMVRKLEQDFAGMVTEVLDRVAPRGECDFVTDIAVPLPLFMIASMMGIRREDYHRFHEWSDAMIASDGNYENAEIMARAGVAFAEYSDYVTAIIEDRRRHPQDDLVTILAGADSRGDLRRFDRTTSLNGETEEQLALANNELLLLLVILLVAGNETTRNGMSGGMQLLIEHPDQRAKLLADLSLVPAAVEEMLRLVSPVVSFGRTVTRDTELRGRRLRAGQQVLLLYGAANRDPDVFEDPEAFRIDRGAQHLAFGIGTHFCLGANLARMEMRVLFDALLRRLPNMTYANGGPRFGPSALVRSCTEMRVCFTPERAAAATAFPA